MLIVSHHVSRTIVHADCHFRFEIPVHRVHITGSQSRSYS